MDGKGKELLIIFLWTSIRRGSRESFDGEVCLNWNEKRVNKRPCQAGSENIDRDTSLRRDTC